MTRRRILGVGVGVAAVVAGLGWGLRRQAAVSARDDDGAESAHPVDLWSLRFETPEGGAVGLATLRGRPLLLNFWATWCPPCIEEMPMLDRFQREHHSAGWQVLGLAVDDAEPVRQFLARHPVGFAIGLAATQGVTLSRTLGNARGALPFSVIFDARGESKARKLGALSWTELTAWAELIA
jgi:thiol-disulfide isomerase/thioredoxin